MQLLKPMVHTFKSEMDKLYLMQLLKPMVHTLF